MANGSVLQRVIDNDLCAGCGLCQGVANPNSVSLEIDGAGFYRPIVTGPLSPKAQDEIAYACPGLNVSHEGNTDKHDVLLGPYLSAYSGWAVDSQIRHIGSSGGVLSAIQVFLLENKVVDFVLSTSVSKSDPFLNVPRICRTREDVLESAGSRYGPSSPLVNIGELLAGSEKFAFVGKPCDVSALRRLGYKDKRVAEKIPVMLSFMCAGVPSILATYKIIESLDIDKKDVVSFRYRGDGWPGYARAELTSGGAKTLSYDESWGKFLSPNVQWRCKLCADGTGESADITGADAWHKQENGRPDFSEREGRSFIIARTPVGESILAAARDAHGVELECSVTASDIESVQKHQAYRKRTIGARYFALICLGMGYPKYNRKSVLKLALGLAPSISLRVFLGTLKRALAKK